MRVQRSEIKILSFGPNDRGEILGLYRQCEDFLALGPVAVASMDMVEADLQHSFDLGSQFCGIYHAVDELIGVVDYLAAGFEGEHSVGFINLLMLAGPWRGKGFGRTVVELIEQIFVNQSNVNQVVVAVQTNNPAAIRFWQQLGYAAYTPAQLQADGTTTIRMRKHLSGGREVDV